MTKTTAIAFTLGYVSEMLLLIYSKSSVKSQVLKEVLGKKFLPILKSVMPLSLL